MGFMDDKRIQMAFLDEVGELLESLNTKLIELENNPEDKEVINEIFRLTHSIKSESAIVGFMNVSEIAHKMEDIFEKVRRAILTVNTSVMNILFAAFDKMMKIMAAVQQGNDESTFNVEDEIINLQSILEDKSGKPVKNTAKETVRQSVKKKDDDTAVITKDQAGNVFAKQVILHKLDDDFNDIEKVNIEEGLEKKDNLYRLTVSFIDTCEMRYPRSYLVYNNLLSCGSVIKTIPDLQSEAEDADFQPFVIYILSKKKSADLIKAADIDQIQNIVLGKVDLKALVNKGFDLSNIPGFEDMLVGAGAEMAISDEEIKEGELIELAWEKQIKEDYSRAKIKDHDAGSGNAVKKGSLDDMTLKKQTIRVDTDRLDILMNLVGELIINHSRYMQIRNGITESSNYQDIKSNLEDATNELERISSLMQVSMMSVRMVPIGYVFSKFPRVVRDLSNMLRKNVRLVIEGETTEIDRAIIELITEPITHLIRNSIDHGIELPEEREKSGKVREGTINLKAYQQGSNIFIEINDDGKGMNLDNIKNKAIQKKIITAQEASVMTKQEALNLIFKPGFSTKEEITGISGRGVGMDVVITQIEKLRGRVEVNTVYGSGTNITIILPLTLTIVEALLVNIAANLFAIPVSVVEETIIVKKSEIIDFDEYKVYNLRDETIAILYLSELVEIDSASDSDDVFIVVVSYARRKIGIVVDDLIGNQDIVIKALDESLKKLDGVAGATVLGDGKIAIILDINTLVRSKRKELARTDEKLQIFEEGGNFGKFYDSLNKPEEKTKPKPKPSLLKKAEKFR